MGGQGAGNRKHEKNKELNAFFTSVFTGKLCFRETQAVKHSGKVWSTLPLADKEQIREHLKILYIPKSVDPSGVTLNAEGAHLCQRQATFNGLGTW